MEKSVLSALLLLQLLHLPGGGVEGAGAQWTSWGEWGECSSTCGGGERSRWRRCTAGGSSAVESLLAADLQCPGEGREAGECWSRPCLVAVQLRSSGGAGEHWGHLLGEYQEVAGEEREGKPVYRQRQDGAMGAELTR